MNKMEPLMTEGSLRDYKTRRSPIRDGCDLREWDDRLDRPNPINPGDILNDPCDIGPDTALAMLATCTGPGQVYHETRYQGGQSQ